MSNKNYLKKGFSPNFVLIPREVLISTKLTWEAKGLLSYMLDKPEGWEFSYKGIAAQGKNKVSSVRRISDQLKEAGVLKITSLKCPKTKKFIGYEWDISNFQIIFPKAGFPADGFPADGNLTQEILNKKYSSKRYSNFEKNRDNKPDSAAESLPPKEKKKEPKYKMSQEEQTLLKEIIEFIPSKGSPVEASFVTAMFKEHGFDKVKKAWEFCKSKEIKSTLGGLMRSALKAGWEAPSETFYHNKRICEDFAKMSPGRLNITQSYMTCAEIGIDVDFKLPTEEVYVLLEKIRKRLGFNFDHRRNDEVSEDLGEFDL